MRGVRRGPEGQRARVTGDEARRELHHRRSRRCRCRGLAFGPTATHGIAGGHLPPAPFPRSPEGGGSEGGRRCMTPRQACPRPNGLGRNLRSKTRWFTGFCNSHQVSHFATFFIDARAEISVAESRFVFSRQKESRRRRARTADGMATARALRFRFGSLARFAPGVRCSAEGGTTPIVPPAP